MQSINMLHKNFQEDHTNSRRFPGVVDTLYIQVTLLEYTQLRHKNSLIFWHNSQNS